MKRLALFTAAGAALAYFFDPQSGKRRRHMTTDRIAGALRRLGRRARHAARHVTSEVHGARMKATHRHEEPKPQPNDAALVQKVESEVFRDRSIPKGRINVNAEDGVVVLRGQVDSPELVEQLDHAVRRVRGVRDVRNLLHTAAAD